MPIALDVTSRYLKLRALHSPNFTKDRDLLAKLPGRIPRYGINPETQRDEFLYWESPLENLSLILETWGIDAILASPEALEKIEKTRLKFIDIDGLPRLDIFFEKLKKHQHGYVSINLSKNVLLLADETGTGKTISSLYRHKVTEGKKLFVICPKRLLGNWRTNIKEILGIPPLIYIGAKIKREKLKSLLADSQIILTNYEQVKEIEKLNLDFDNVIVDEIHTVCSPKTYAHKSIFKVLRRSQGHIQGLSATPKRLTMEDLWGVLRLLDPEFAGPLSSFLKKYQKVLASMPVKKFGRTFYVPIKVTSQNEDKLREKLKAIMYRSKKETIVDFKDNIDIIDVDLTPRQASMYQEALSTLKLELSDKTLELGNPLAKMTRLLQISEGIFNLDDKHKDSGKLDFLKEELKDKAGEKIVIWSRFEPITRLIKDLFPKETVIYSGQVSKSLQDLAVWAFQGVTNREDEEEFNRLKKYNSDFKFDPGGANIFVGTHNLRSGLGINLHKAHLCYFTSYDWNGAAIMQARDRISRIGQDVDTQCYFLVSADTIEREALKLILQKYENSVSILDGKGSINSTLTRELIALLYKQ